jgi:hypothetical protein
MASTDKDLVLGARSGPTAKPGPGDPRRPGKALRPVPARPQPPLKGENALLKLTRQQRRHERPYRWLSRVGPPVQTPAVSCGFASALRLQPPPSALQPDLRHWLPAVSWGSNGGRQLICLLRLQGFPGALLDQPKVAAGVIPGQRQPAVQMQLSLRETEKPHCHPQTHALQYTHAGVNDRPHSTR